MAAQIEVNPETGLFEVVEPAEPAGEVIQESTDEGVIYDDSVIPSDEVVLPDEEVSPEDLLEFLEPDSLEDPQEAEPDPSYDDLIDLYSVAPSTASYNPQAWQVNLAQSRGFGEHYLIWAERVYYTSTSSYWRYYEVVGRDISKEGDIYTYEDCDLYSYYSYSNYVNYDVSESSGTVDGSSYVVYSDLYFDYAGGVPSDHVTPFVTFGLLLMILLLIMCRRSS